MGLRARILLTPLYAGSIWLEERAARAGFSRALLQAGGACPPDAELVEVQRRGVLANEPLKDRTAAALDVVMRRGEPSSSLPVFVKFQSGRGFPLHPQAVRAAVEPGVAREVDFYRRVADSASSSST